MNGGGVKVVIFYYFVTACAKISRFFIPAADGNGVSESGVPDAFRSDIRNTDARNNRISKM